MSLNVAIALLLTLAVIAANLPWLSERIFFVIAPRKGVKSAWFRLLETVILYFVVGGLGLGLEQKIYGEIHHQGWIFYVVTACLFLVFGLPGFIYRYDLKIHLQRLERRER